MLLDEALAKYTVQLEADGRSPHTIGQAKRHVRRLRDWLVAERRSTQVEDLTSDDVAAFFASDSARLRADGKPKGATSVNSMRSSLRTFAAYCHNAGWAPNNAARLLRRARCGSPPPRGIRDEDLERLLKTVAAASGEEAARDVVWIKLAADTGLRIGSLTGLDIEDVDLDARELRVRRAKGNRPDIVFVPRSAIEYLRTHIGERTSGPLFVTGRGARLSARHAQRRMAKWLETAGVQRKASPHDLRHRFARKLLAKTGDISVCQRALLHRSVSSTAIYAAASDSALRAALGA